MTLSAGLTGSEADGVFGGAALESRWRMPWWFDAPGMMVCGSLLCADVGLLRIKGLSEMILLTCRA